MARTQEEIRDQIYDNLASNSTFATMAANYATYDDLPDGSYIKALITVMAAGHYTHESLWDDLQADIDATAETLKPHIASWYADQVKAFQSGYTVELVDGVPGYSTADADAQIVKRVAVLRPAAGRLTIKVAKENSSGTPQALDSTEKAALESYLSQIADAGTQIGPTAGSTLVTSDPPDELQISYDLYYDPQIGQATAEAQAEEAIESYLASIDFGGQYRETDLIASVKAVTGIVDIDVTGSTWTPNGGSPTANAHVYELAAGYGVLTTATPNSIPS